MSVPFLANWLVWKLVNNFNILLRVQFVVEGLISLDIFWTPEKNNNKKVRAPRVVKNTKLKNKAKNKKKHEEYFQVNFVSVN